MCNFALVVYHIRSEHVFLSMFDHWSHGNLIFEVAESLHQNVESLPSDPRCNFIKVVQNWVNNIKMLILNNFKTFVTLLTYPILSRVQIRLDLLFTDWSHVGFILNVKLSFRIRLSTQDFFPDWKLKYRHRPTFSWSGSKLDHLRVYRSLWNFIVIFEIHFAQFIFT